MKPAVFLDRDGVLSIPIFGDGRSYAPLRVGEFKLYPDAKKSVERLRQRGFFVVVVTNQPDVGAGRLSRSDVELMHDILLRETGVDLIEVCFETKTQALQSCSGRRKPGPRMFLDAALKLGIALESSYVVGDRASDVAAGFAAGCRSAVFIDRGYTRDPRPHNPTTVVRGLMEAVDWIVCDTIKESNLLKTDERRP